MGKLKQKFTTPLLQLYDINKNFVCNLTNRTLRNSAYSIKKKMPTNDVKTLTDGMLIEIKIPVAGCSSKYSSLIVSVSLLSATTEFLLLADSLLEENIAQPTATTAMTANAAMPITFQFFFAV